MAEGIWRRSRRIPTQVAQVHSHVLGSVEVCEFVRHRSHSLPLALHTSLSPYICTPHTPLAAQPAASMAGSMNPCEERVREFADCMTRANGDMSACQFYFESMNTCKLQNRMA